MPQAVRHPLTVALALALLVPAPALARTYEPEDLPEDLDFSRTVEEGGPLAKVLFLPGGPAYAIGGGGQQYFGEHFHFGGRGWGGMIGSTGGIGFGGFVVGGSSRIGDWLHWKLDATIGGGGGGSGTIAGGGFFGIEPTLALGLNFGEGASVDVNAGYLLASNTAFSGPTVGLRVNFKTVTYSATVPYGSPDAEPNGKDAEEGEE